jgi:hypothetical protein
MDEASIMFQFENRQAAFYAFDTLEELGYTPVFHTDEARPKLHIHVNQSDLTSALEIAQAHGGVFIEKQASEKANMTEHQAFLNSYFPDGEGITIPAHVVNEDWTEEYAGANVDRAVPEQGELYERDESYDHFSADVRI